MKVRTQDLIETALDWAVAKCEGYAATIKLTDVVYVHPNGEWHHNGNWIPSTNWAQGGPIIGAIKGFEFKHWLESKPDTCCEAHIHNYEGDWIQFGPTQLIAALRCYVASKLGDEVDIPDELV